MNANGDPLARHEDDETGASKLTLYLNEINDDSLGLVQEKLGDLLVELGFNESDENITALVKVEGFLWPEDATRMFVDHLADAAVVMIPGPGAGTPE